MDNFNWNMLTTYNIQHFQVDNIFRLKRRANEAKKRQTSFRE